MSRTRRVSERLVLVWQDTWQQMKQAQLLLVASSLAYTTILSIIPLLAVSFAIFQAFGGLDRLRGVIEPFIISNLAEGVSDDVMEKIQGFISNAHAGALGIGGLVGLVFTSMSMLSNIENAINRVWAAPVSRSWFTRISAYWLVITLGPLGLAAAIGVATSANLPMNHFLPSGGGLFLIAVGLFFATYKWVPHTRVKKQFALIAALITAIFFILAQLAFKIYTAKVLTYSKIYGSLAAVPIVLLWIYIVWIVVLTGAAISAALQRRFDLGEELRLAAIQASSRQDASN